MRKTKWLERRSVVVVAALVLGSGFELLRARDASSEPMVTDGAPSGMVAFVGGGVCPPGWVKAEGIQGRAIVGTVIKEDVGVEVGTPLDDREDRLHLHNFTGTVTLVAKGIGAPDGANTNVAAPATYSLGGMTDEGAAGLPFFQMEGCVKP